MYLKVQIPARFLIMQSDTVSDPIELGVIGTKTTQFTLMELNSTNAPWIQYSKNKDHIFKPADFTNTMPLFRSSDGAGNVSNKIRPNKFPKDFHMTKLTFIPLNPTNMSPRNLFTDDADSIDLPSNFKDSALNLELFQQQDGNALLDNYLDVRLKGVESFMDWVSGQDDMFGFQNSGVLRKNNPNLNVSRGGLVWSNTHLWGDNDLSDSTLLPSIMRPVKFDDYAFSDKDKSGYGLLPFNENALDVDFQQRMIADAPYNLSTVKFNTTQTHPVSLLYRYQSAINEDADKLRVASSGYRRYTEFKPPLLDWEGLGYPRLSLTKSSSELRRKPIQITFSKNRQWIMKPSLAEATEKQFASEIFSIKKLFHSNDKEFSTFDKTLLESNSYLRSTKCYGLTDFKRKYYHNPETPVDIDENENYTWLETSKLEPKENLEIHTYGYAQYGYGLSYKMEKTDGLHTTIGSNETDYGGKTRYYDTRNNKKINAEPYWVRDSYRNDKPPGDVIGVNPSNGEYDRMRFINHSGALHYIRNTPQILSQTTIETEMKGIQARNLKIAYEMGYGGEIPTSTSPHWSAWKASVANVKGVKFKSDNFFKIFDYQTCFHNNLNRGSEHRYISNELDNLNYAIFGMHKMNPNKLIKKWWKKQVKDGKIDATKDIPLYNIKVEDVLFREGKKKMNGFKITYTIPYIHFSTFRDGNDDMEEVINPANGTPLYPNYLKDTETITGTADRHGILTSEITIALHPDKLGVSTFVKYDSIHSIQIYSNEVRLIQYHIDDVNIHRGIVDLVNVLKMEANVKVGEANHFTRTTNLLQQVPTDKTNRATIDETGNTKGSDRDIFSTQPLQTSIPSVFTGLDDCFMMYNYALQKGLLGREFVSTQHIRSGFTVSDPLSLPLTFKKGKVTPVGNFKYTYPLPYRRLNSYLTSTGEIFRPDNNLSTYNYLNLGRYELPTGLAPLDLTKAIPAPNNDLDETHGGVVSLFTSTNYDTKKELEEVVWVNAGHRKDGLRIVDESEKKSLLETLKNLKRNRFKDGSDKSLTTDYAKVVKNTLASKDLTKKEGTFIHFITRKSDTDGKSKVNGKDKPNFEFRMQKVGGRLMKYGKDNQGYTRGKIPKDYTIFADLILPFAPRVLRVDKVGSDSDSSENVWNMTIGKNNLQGVYNYQPQRRGSTYISDDVSNYLQGVPSEWCPETYTYFGRTLGLFNWWGSLL